MYKTTSNINPQYMKEIFKLKGNKRLLRQRFKLKLEIGTKMEQSHIWEKKSQSFWYKNME